MGTRRRGAAARAGGESRPAAAATSVRTRNAGDRPPVRHDPSPLAVMVATMRWAQEAATRLDARAATLHGTERNDAATLSARLWGLARRAAKEAAPYLRARLAAAAPHDPRTRAYEEWLRLVVARKEVRHGH